MTISTQVRRAGEGTGAPPAGVTLEYEKGSLPLAVHESSEGPSGIEIGSLLKETGHVTLDIGFVNTAACASAITYIDGDAGILRYRGYPIDELAQKSSFLEVSYLLIYGKLPTSQQLADFTARIKTHTLLREEMRRFFDGFPRDAHPMAVLSSGVSALSTFYQDSLEPMDTEQVEISTVRLLAKLPTIASYAHKTSMGQPLLYPDNSLGYVEDFLRMTFGLPTTPYEVDPVVARVLDMLFVLHADHEQNCSTSTVRLVGSSHANLFASVSAGVNALFGPLHGGANQAVLQMLAQIHASGDDAEGFVRKVKSREGGVKLMGFGHRVYRNYDPRAAIVKKAAQQILSRTAAADPLPRSAAPARSTPERPSVPTSRSRTAETAVRDRSGTRLEGVNGPGPGVRCRGSACLHGHGSAARGRANGTVLPVHNRTIWRPWEPQSSDYPPARNRRSGGASGRKPDHGA